MKINVAFYSKIFITIAVAAFAITAQAKDSLESVQADLAKIAANSNSAERLAAYDAFVAKLTKPETGAEKKTEGKGKWKVTINTSPVDDSKTVTASLDANESVKTSLGEERPTLIVRFKEGKLSAYVYYGLYLGVDEIPVTLRFGSEKAVNEKWDMASSHKAVFVAGSVSQFLQNLKNSESFLIRLTPFGESPVTSTFSTEGVTSVVDSILGAAGK